MAGSDLSAQAIREVQFREKVRGYHPGDVDAFVASVAETVANLERRARETEVRLAELESRSAAATHAEDALRRTLVLAQRTADLAMQEARDAADQVNAETATERARAEAELAELRERLTREADEAGRAVRDHLEGQRAALLADVTALEAHLARERERLRIYFSDQLRRVEEGEPGIPSAPSMQADVTPDAATDVATPGEGGVDERTAPVEADTGAAGAPAAAPAPEAPPAPGDDGVGGDGVAAAGQDDDPFLAELRRAVNDEQPLGPREDEPERPTPEEGEDPFDLFAKGDDDGRFGSRLRRRR